MTHRFTHVFFTTWCLLMANTMLLYGQSQRSVPTQHSQWWDVQHYTLDLSLDIEQKAISGTVLIKAVVSHTNTDTLQIDLQDPLQLNSVHINTIALSFVKTTGAYLIPLSSLQQPLALGDTFIVKLHYEGQPTIAKNPPWDGGFSWQTHKGQPWVSVSCQGNGASIWWPCKDDQSDKPDEGMRFYLNVPKDLTFISNGQKYYDTLNQRYFWQTTYPINLYNITFYVGDYVQAQALFQSNHVPPYPYTFHVLKSNKKQLKSYMPKIKDMLTCFENWMGPYPFHNDGYQLVEAPYLGMEHQSAVAYGNKFKKGYLGMDRSGTKHGLLFDYILVHESGHEWFGNAITASDEADNWIHEGFTSYTEVIYLECIANTSDAEAYLIGLRKNIANSAPIIAPYGQHNAGDGDKYDKGAQIVHMMRTIMGDTTFKKWLKNLFDEYQYKTLSTAQLEAHFARTYGKDLSTFFQQYLRTTQIPTVEYQFSDGVVKARLVNALEGLELPLRLNSAQSEKFYKIHTTWQTLNMHFGDFQMDKSFYVNWQLVP